MVVNFDPNNFTELVCDLESKDKTEEPEGIELPCLSLGSALVLIGLIRHS